MILEIISEGGEETKKGVLRRQDRQHLHMQKDRGGDAFAGFEKGAREKTAFVGE